MTVRTPEEILARIEHIEGSDIFGVESTDLKRFLPFEKACPFLTKEFLSQADAEQQWADQMKATPEERIRDYLPFAIGKALGHRGLSAGRSIAHMQAWVWLMGDEAFAQVGWDNYAMYGVPILEECAALSGFEWPGGHPLNRMAEGRPCRDGCQDGCLDG